MAEHEMNREEVRAKILADPNTARIAATVGMSLEQYVNEVLKYALNPGLEPSLLVMSDEDLERLGAPPPPRQEEIQKFVSHWIEVASAAEKTDYTDSKVNPLELTPHGHRVEDEEPTLRPDIERERKKTHKI